MPVLDEIATRARAGRAALAACLAAGDGRPVTLITSSEDIRLRGVDDVDR